MGDRHSLSNAMPQREFSRNVTSEAPKPVYKESSGLDALDVLDSKWSDIHAILTKSYLQRLNEDEVVPFQKEYSQDRLRTLRWFRIDRIVYEQGTFFVDKFSMILSALHNEARELVLLLHKEKGGRIQLYLGTCDQSDENRFYAGETLSSSLRGVFPGIQMTQMRPDKLLDFEGKAISAVSVVGSLHDDDKEGFVQGLDRLINATENINDFTAMMVAECVGEEERLRLMEGYADMYSMLAPLASVQIATNQEISRSLTAGESEALSETLTEGVNRTITHGTNSSRTVTDTKGTTKTDGKTITNGFSYNKTFTAGGGASVSGVSAFFATSDSYGVNHSVAKSSSTSESSSTSIGETRGVSESTSEGINRSTSSGTTYSTNKSESLTQGEGRTITLTQHNKRVEHLLERIEKQMERIDDHSAYGMWNCATYIIAPTTTTSKQLANIYKGCVVGEESNFEVTAVNTWSKEQSDKVASLAPYLKHYVHPRFLVDGQYDVSAGSLVNSKDLAVHMALPQSSVCGVLVQERAPFGREVFGPIPKRPLELGNIYHLGLKEPTTVALDASAFTKHIFVTGSTGSGKSNTVYHLLDQLMHPTDDNDPVKVLVIEPAKGEYKNVLKEAKVYGTNPSLSTLLRINPFAFPEEVRVDEHVDRLVEIFNVCWPMYAAMPAVLKDSILRAYQSAGWDLSLSVPKRKGLFPTFTDVLRELRNVIRSSEYSADTQGDYIGSLETRIRSLTNGINAHIFSSCNCIEDAALFDENVVVDLSRIGSSETRSLIMGILMLKLSEYRMATANGVMNQPLRHVTVLEEAHNLLKRTSKEQSQEGANLVGKSVEMIANAIAEMRTYGEGFIIADQSPTSVDESAIKNTNTKIIMSLPDGDDKQVAGKSVGLTDEQIEEITRMPVGVGIIYQNNWSEAVMCQIKEFELEEESMRAVEPDALFGNATIDLDIITLLLRPNRRLDRRNLDVRIQSANISAADKLKLLEMVDDYTQLSGNDYFEKWIARVRAGILSRYLNLNVTVQEICREFGVMQMEAIILQIKQLMPRELAEINVEPNHFADFILLSTVDSLKEGMAIFDKWRKLTYNN